MGPIESQIVQDELRNVHVVRYEFKLERATRIPIVQV